MSTAARAPTATAASSSASTSAHASRHTGVRLLVLSCVVIWGWTFVAMKILLAHVNAIELVGLRFGIGLPILYAVIRWKRVPLRFARADAKPLAIGAALILFHFLVQPIGIDKTTATNTGWIIAVSPLALCLLSTWLLKERVTAREIVGVLLATSGIVLLISRGEFSSLWQGSVGDWIILATAVNWAVYTIATRDLSRRRPALAVTLAVFAPLTLVSVGYIAAHRGLGVFAGFDAQAWIAIVFLGTLGTLAQWFWQEGVARLGAAKAGIFLYLEPIATTVLAVPLLHERFDVTTAIGGAMVLAGVWWAQRPR